MSKDMMPAAPISGADAEMRMLAVSAIEESLTNPRTHFDAAKLGELAESIAASGVHQPILVRPLPGTRLADTFGFRRAGEPLPTHELVAGARRLRACRMAKVAEIPVMIRPLTDDQVLEIQIVENLQRDDLSELEEAEGYERLMKHSGLTVDQVAGKIAKSRAYVYARLKLTALCQDGRKALREGKIDASKALLLARIPDEKLQVQALDYVSSTDYRGSPISYRSAAEHIQQNYMLRLDAARFKITDATLVPAAGACRDCSKRTGAEPDLFADVKSADTCTYPPCFHQKEEAQAALVRQQAHERGQTIIDGKEAKALIPNSWGSVEGGYLRLDDKRDNPAGDKPLRKLIAKQMETAGIQPTLIANPHKDGELVAVLPAATVSELLRAAGQDAPAEKVATELQRDEKNAKAKEAEDRKRRYEERWRLDVLRDSIARMNAYDQYGASDDVLRYAARHYAALLNVDQAKVLCKLLDLGKVAPKDGITQYVEGHEDPGHALMVLIAFRDSGYSYWRDDQSDQNKGLMLVASECEIDVEGVKARTKANMRAEDKLAEAKEAEKLRKASIPLAPAAPAAGGAGGKAESGAKAKKPAAKTSPAARAVKPKATAAEASRDIAAALQAAEGADPGAADAAQSDERHPRLRADAVASAEVAGPAAAALESAWNMAFPPQKPARGTASATSKDDKPAEHQLGLDVGFMAGQRVEVKENATGPGAKYRGRLGKVSSKMGDRAYMVTITGRNGGLAKSLSFDESELEAVPA